MDILNNQACVVDNPDELEISMQNEGQVYPMDGIKVDKGFYTVFELKRRYDANPKRIILDSDFQREDVWKKAQKAELIESVLMGLPLPVFYFNQDKYGRLIVVDGRQRLTALFDYMSDRFPLKNLKILPELNDLKFSELPPGLDGRIEDYQIQAHVIMPPTPERIKFDIFDRVNRGGMQLNKQEIRNALYQGVATKLLNRIVEGQAFQDATGNAFKKETRMKDKYLLTRFIAFCLFREGRLVDDVGEQYQYADDIDELLGKGMEAVNQMHEEEVMRLGSKIEETLKKSYFYLGENAFRVIREGKRSPINMNVFESIMFALQWIPEGLVSQKEIVREKIFGFIDSPKFKENIGNHRDSAVNLEWRLSHSEQVGRFFAE